MRSIKELEENMATAIGRDLTVSTKDAIEISNFIRGKNTNKAKAILQRIIDLKEPIPYKRFLGDRGHKSGKGSGKFPISTATAILKIVKTVEANASVKGLNTSSLIIKYIIPNRASRSYHYGRRRGLKTKGTHIEIVVEEVSKKKEETSKSNAKKLGTKPEPKKEEKKTEKSVENKEMMKKETKEKNTEAPKKEEKKEKPTDKKEPAKKEEKVEEKK